MVLSSTQGEREPSSFPRHTVLPLPGSLPTVLPENREPLKITAECTEELHQMVWPVDALAGILKETFQAGGGTIGVLLFWAGAARASQVDRMPTDSHA